MKTALTILILTLTFHVSASDKTNFVDVYKQKRGSFKLIRIPMTFDSDSITRRRIGTKIDMVYQIDYVATSTNGIVSSVQRRLDKKRWNTMLGFTGIIDDATFVTNKFYQTKAKSKEEARGLFHGFVIYYRESAEALHASSFVPLSGLMSKMSGSIINEKSTYANVPAVEKIDSIYVGEITVEKRKSLNKRLERDNYIIEWGYDSLGIDGKYYNSFYMISKVSAGIYLAYKALKDISLFSMLRKTNFQTNSLIATDLTGSMYPYYAQLLVWHSLNLNEKTKMNFMFFNDGDMKSHEEKRVGNTGGLYPIRTQKTFELYKEMSKCMAGGGGGDCPENNFEAVVEGTKKFKDANHITLICDNWAVPRDTALLQTIDFPIDFIMCGTDFGINPVYLDLARQNGGRVITMENSIERLEELKEGESINVGGKFYELIEGKFKLYE